MLKCKNSCDTFQADAVQRLQPRLKYELIRSLRCDNYFWRVNSAGSIARQLLRKASLTRLLRKKMVRSVVLLAIQCLAFKKRKNLTVTSRSDAEMSSEIRALRHKCFSYIIDTFFSEYALLFSSGAEETQKEVRERINNGENSTKIYVKKCRQALMSREFLHITQLF